MPHVVGDSDLAACGLDLASALPGRVHADAGDLYADDTARFAERMAGLRERMAAVPALGFTHGLSQSGASDGHVPKWVLAIPPTVLHSTGKLVLAAVTMRSNPSDQKGGYASQERIGQDVGGMDRKSVRAHLHRLRTLCISSRAPRGRGFELRLVVPFKGHPLLKLAERDAHTWRGWLDAGEARGWIDTFR